MSTDDGESTLCRPRSQTRGRKVVNQRPSNFFSSPGIDDDYTMDESGFSKKPLKDKFGKDCNVSVLKEETEDYNSIWCNKHGKDVSRYCKSHKIPLCYACLHMHSKCMVDSLAALAKGVKDTEKFNNIETSVHNVSKYMEDLKPVLEKEVSLIRNKREVFLKSIDDTRKTLLVIIENYKDEGLRNIEDKMAEMQKLLTDISNLKSSVIEKKERIAYCREFAEDAEIFVALPKIEKSLHRDEKMLSTLQNKGLELIEPVVKLETVNEQTFQISYDPREHQFRELSSISETLSTSRIRRMQDVQIGESFVFDIPSGGNEGIRISHCAMLSNGELCFVDLKNNCLVLRKLDGTFKSFHLQSVPCGITVISNSEIAVLHRSSVAIANLHDNFVTEFKFRSVGKFRHITFHRQNLIVCVGSDCFFVINLEGKKIKEINIDEDLISCISCWDNKIYYANSDKNKICSVDLQSGVSELVMNIEQIVKLPTDIASDGSGFMFVVGSFKNNVVAISTNDKNFHKELIQGIANVNHPKAMAYNPARRRLLICSRLGQAVLYTLR